VGNLLAHFKRYVLHLQRIIMSDFKQKGKKIREDAKNLVIEYMHQDPACQKNSDGIRLSELFRNCSFDWREYQNVTSSNQQY